MTVNNERCKVCVHSDRAAIEVLLVRGTPCTVVARKFGLRRSSVAGHKKRHIDQAVARRLKAKALRLASAEDLEELRADEAQNLLLRVAHTRARINKVLDAAEKEGDYRAVIAAFKPLHDNYALTGKLVGELAQGQTVINNCLTLSPDYLRLRSLLIDCLRPYPAARIAVTKALRQLETPTSTAEPKRIADHRDGAIEVTTDVGVPVANNDIAAVPTDTTSRSFAAFCESPQNEEGEGAPAASAEDDAVMSLELETLPRVIEAIPEPTGPEPEDASVQSIQLVKA
jgi:hypothetical protein